MATFYILAENGDRLLTEDGNDLLVTEARVEDVGGAKYFVQIVYAKSRRRFHLWLLHFLMYSI